MFSGIRRAFGLIKVEESVTEIEISGIPADVLARDIGRMWNTERINREMFSQVTRNSIRFPKFFAIEVHYILQQIDQYRNAKSTSRTLRSMIQGLEENTWLKRLNETSDDGSAPTRMDLSQLKNLNAKLFEHQDSFLKAYGELTTKYGLNGYLLSAEPGTGKAQPLDAPIRVPGGWSTMGDMTVGTKVIAKDGSVTEVTGVFPQGEKLIYRVTFADGRTTECCGEHLWKVRWYSNGAAFETIVDTLTIADSLRDTQDEIYIPFIDPEERPDKALPMDPYEMAMMLAGGDPAIPRGYLDEYLDGSIAQRKAFLQGLLDTDATFNEWGVATYSTHCEPLAKDIQRLVWSLGGLASLNEVSDAYYEVVFAIPEHTPNYRAMLAIASVEPIGMKSAQCIMIAHPEHLYVTSDYIVTHNTIMGLAAAECLHSDLTIVVSPKPAVYRVWVDTVKWLYKKPKAYWVAGENQPWKNQRLIITHYEALGKALDVIKRIPHQKAVVILDESHNLNEAKSNRTQLFLDVCKAVKTENALWSSGTPLKAMGYEMIPFLRSIDPLFTEDVERRFMKIFGRASDRALDILRNRIGKISYHVSGAAVIDVKKHYEELKIKLPDGDKYTVANMRREMREFADEKLAYYLKHMKEYRKKWEAGVEAYRNTMSPEDKDKLKKYERDVNWIAKGFDTRDPQMVEAAKFCNLFEKRKIIPAITDKTMRDDFIDAKSVVKYPRAKTIGLSLGVVLGRARSRLHIEMVKHVNWKTIAEKTDKKVLVFTSFVEVVKAADAEIRKAGYKTTLVYGETSNNLAALVDQFGKDPSIKFLIATYQTLSTAVPLTMADVTVFVDQNPRSYMRDQSTARTARIGGSKNVTYIDLLLDTGQEGNISTRMKDIMEWSRDMLASMGVGGEASEKEAISTELNKDYSIEALEELFLE